MPSNLTEIRMREPDGRGRKPCATALLAWLPVWLWVVAAGALAASPFDVYEFPSPEHEMRYYALIDEFRCPKCLNTNLAGSDAPIAQDLRRTVHRLLVQDNLSDQAIRDYLQERYGDFVLYDPPFRPGTWLLWLAPVGFLAIGAWVWLRMLRQPEGPASLSEEDRARLADIVGEQRGP